MMELEDKVEKISLSVERHSSEIQHLKDTVESHGERIENFAEFMATVRAEQEARDKSLNRLLTIVTVISALSPVVSAYLTSLMP